MAISNDKFIKLFEDIKNIYQFSSTQNKEDTLAESTLLAYLISEYSLLNYFQCGTEINENFLSASHAVKQIKGGAYIALSSSKDEEFFNKKNRFNQAVEKFSLSDTSYLIEEKADLNKFFQHKIGIDLLYITDEDIGQQEEIEKLFGMVNEKGFVVCDVNFFNKFKRTLKQRKKEYVVFFECQKFLVFRIGHSLEDFSILEKRKIENLYSMVENRADMKSLLAEGQSLPLVSVFVIAYNQEKYIAECLQGIFAQKGNFQLELVIGDDASHDETYKIIQDYIANFGGQVIIKDISSSNNVGMTRNFQRCLNACTGDFIAVCEGDDYWIDCFKLQKQLVFLKNHPACSICFNNIYVYFEETKEYIKFDLQQQLNAEVIKTKDLVLEYYIGNLSCCMYDARYMKEVSEGLFDLYIGDWMFNIYYSCFGDIGHIKECMSVYRKHIGGVWSGRSPVNRDIDLYSKIEEYNSFLEYEFDFEFSIVQNKIASSYPFEFQKKLLDIAIIDEIFPHPLSSFRFEEFLAYLKNFSSMIIYSTGASISFFGDRKLTDLIIDFKKRYSEFANKVRAFSSQNILDAKVFYFVFLGNAYANLDYIENLSAPFIFTLYPGGHFGIDNPRSDRMLKRVTSSPCFRKVVVTQKITYDYLIKKKICTHEQIEFIFGVVTPLEQLEREYVGKKHFGVDKDVLDICFVAHKYTEKGIDKGYDVFIAVATALSQKHQNIRFHVVGGFDENVLDVNHLQGKIKFYGNQEIEWFDEFYLDKDIILSPNIPFKIFEGSFDGFPTGSCTDAGLRETAIFCTDELNLNDGFFVNGEELVVIPHDAVKIVEEIEFYYSNPEKLATIGKNGRKKIKELYGYEAQILPRINILQTEIDLFERNKVEIHKKFDSIMPLRKRLSRLTTKIRRLSSMFFAIAREKTPTRVKNGLKRILPSFVIRIYERFFI